MASGQLFTFLIHVRALDGILDSKGTPDYTITQDGVTEDFFDGLLSALEDAWNVPLAGGGLRDFWVSNNFSYDIPFNGTEAEFRLTLDYDRTKREKSTILRLIRDVVQNTITDARHTSGPRTVRNDIPTTPVFKLVTDEPQDESKFGYKFNLFWGQPQDAGHLLEWEVGEPLPYEEPPIEPEVTESETTEDVTGPTQETIQESDEGTFDATGEDVTDSTDDTPIPQEKEEETEEEEEFTGDPVSLEQIFGPEIKPTIIEFKTGEEVTPGQAKNIGLSIQQAPFIYYNGIQIEPGSIIHFHLYHEEMLPACKIVFRDTNGIFRGIGFPPDNTVMTVYIDSKSENLRSVYMDFKITEFDDMEDDIINMSCICDVPGLYQNIYTSIGNSTGVHALMQLAKSCELGFCSNVEDTDDRMTWVNPGSNRYEFIKEITKHLYSGDTSFFRVYVDWYYNLCLVNVEKELTRDNTDDLMILQTGLDKATDNNVKEKLIPLLLTTDNTAKESNAFVANPRIINSSTKTNINHSYYTRSKTYTTLGKSFDNYLINTGKDGGTETGLKRPDSEDRPLHTKGVWNGKSDPYGDDGNQHREYGYAHILNRVNMRELSKITLDLTLPNPNHNLYLYLKVNFIMTLQKPSISGGMLHTRVSGNAIVDDMEFIFDGNRSYQKVRLIRRDITPFEDDESEQEYVEEEYQDNDNPVPENTDVPETIEDTGSELVVEDETPETPSQETSEPENDMELTESDQTTPDDRLTLDIETITNSIPIPTWEGSQLKFIIRNLNISTEWGIKFSTVGRQSPQWVDVETFSSGKWTMDEDFTVNLVMSKFTKSDLSSIYREVVWSKTMNEPANRQVLIPIFTYKLTFFIDGVVEPIEITDFRFWNRSNDKREPDNKKFDFDMTEHTPGRISCEHYIWTNNTNTTVGNTPPGDQFPSGYCPHKDFDTKPGVLF